MECEVNVDGICLEHISKFKYLGLVFNETGINRSECSRKVARGGRVAGAIRFLNNARDLQLQCVRVMHETLLLPVLIFGCEKM